MAAVEAFVVSGSAIGVEEEEGLGCLERGIEYRRRLAGEED
jgi:hypothetical protein